MYVSLWRWRGGWRCVVPLHVCCAPLPKSDACCVAAALSHALNGSLHLRMLPALHCLLLAKTGDKKEAKAKKNQRSISTRQWLNQAEEEGARGGLLQPAQVQTKSATVPLCCGSTAGCHRPRGDSPGRACRQCLQSQSCTAVARAPARTLVAVDAHRHTHTDTHTDTHTHTQRGKGDGWVERRMGRRVSEEKRVYFPV